MVDLRQRRKELGLTMKQVADAVGVSEATISRYESGNIKNMRRDRLDKYAKALQVEILDMIEINETETQAGAEGMKCRLAERIIEARLKKGVSMRQAAIDMGFPYTTYVNYEKAVSEPNSKGLAKIAMYYQVSADYLIGIDDIVPTEERKGGHPMIALRALRRARGMTQQQVAEQIGVAKNTVSMWEVGEREPSIDKLRKLAALFDCTIDELVNGKTKKKVIVRRIVRRRTNT